MGGRPLIGRAIDAALGSKYISRVIVSTDDLQIAETARRCGAEVPFLRPPELASDTAPEWHAWRHAIEQFDATSTGGPLDVFVSTPATAPLRLPSDIDRCVERFLEHRDSTDVVLTVTTPQSNPYFTTLAHDSAGYARLAFTPPGGPVSRRQDAPEVFDITPVAYVVDPLLVRQHNGLFDGRMRTVFVPPERAVDIDTELDFAFAEFLVARQVRAAA